MSLAFNPLSEEEVLNLIEPGIYDFQVKEAADGTSKTSGNPRIALILTVWDKNGKERIVFDYLTVAMMYKIKHFCDATGLEKMYQAGTFSSKDCIGKSGKCKIRIDESPGYPPKNAVADYVMTDKGAVKVPLANESSLGRRPEFSSKTKDELTDDDIPF